MPNQRRYRILVIALLGFAVVHTLAGRLLTGFRGKPSANYPSYTVRESKARGAFVEAVAIEPRTIDWNGRQIVIGEAWIEHQTELKHVFVIIPCLWHYEWHRDVEGYNLCFNLAEGWDVLSGHRNAFFVADGQRAGFGQMGTVVLWHRFGAMEECPTKMKLTDNWKFENSKTLSITRGNR